MPATQQAPQAAPTKTTKAKTARIEARIAPESLSIVKRAAELQGRSVSDFIVESAISMAQKTIETTSILRLAIEDQRALAQAILEPTQPAPALERAVARYKQLITSSR